MKKYAGLVSKYYIENLDGDKHVEKLITINTPHWGSGLATASTDIPTWGSLETLPLHLDLKPDGKSFGGNKIHMYFFNNTKHKYMNNYQTEKLRYNNHGNTDYYFIAAHDQKYSAVDKEIKNKSFIFNFILSVNSFSAFKDSITNFYFNQYPDHESFINFKFKKSSGDNVVNNQSQLGITYKSFGDGKSINAASYSMLIDTFPDHTKKNHLHGEVPKRAETIRQVMYYLHE